MEHMNDLRQLFGPFSTETMPVAMAYVPFQQWEKLYSAEQGFTQGTIFCALDKPFLGRELKPNE